MTDTPSPTEAPDSDEARALRRGDPEQTPRHFVSYALAKVDRAWRALDPEVRARHREQFVEWDERWREQMMLRTFSTVGVRADADLLLWRATPDWDLLGDSMTELLSTELAPYLDFTYVYTATTKPSQYQKAVSGAGFRRPRPLDVVPIDAKYLIVYPFVKQRRWYALSPEERGAAMREHAIVGRKYPSIKLNTSYSFGIDDQEFMTAFETDEVQDFLDLMMELRSSEASKYTERDTPIFTCRLRSAGEVIDALGGVRAAALA